MTFNAWKLAILKQENNLFQLNLHEAPIKSNKTIR